MNLDDKLLLPAEKAVFLLRALYAAYGYRQYKMSKFEEYDLYVRNKDFLISDNIISFTDTNGRLKALKPDVTLSIIRNTKDVPGGVEKVYYNENVYRVSKSSRCFREIPQAGLECIGDVGVRELREILLLAVRSLTSLGEGCVLDVTHLGVVSAVLQMLSLDRESEETVLKCLSEKNRHGAREACRAAGADPAATELLTRLIAIDGAPEEALAELRALLAETPAAPAVEELANVLAELRDTPEASLLRIDFSAVCDLKYYNGIAFKGYLNGLPGSVLSGGQYDHLMRRMRRTAKAVGFAVYLDQLERSEAAETDGYLNVALPKGRLGEKVYAMFEKAGYECPAIKETNRRLIFENPEKKVRYFWVKPSDVAIYVERGAADLGVAGKDILLEYTPDVYELLDLDVGRCRMAVAGKKDFTEDPAKTLRVATKFTNIAQEYYAGKGRDIDVIHLNGSIELAPILDLSDVIVDIVETGATLKENDLEVKEEIVPISARLIANPAGYKFKHAAILAAAQALGDAVKN